MEIRKKERKKWSYEGKKKGNSDKTKNNYKFKFIKKQLTKSLLVAIFSY